MDTPFKDFPFKTVLSLKPLIDYLKGLGSEGLNVRPHIKKEIDELLDQAPELEGPIEDLSLLERHGEAVGRLMEFVFPPASWETEILGAIVPISMQPFHVSPGFRDLFLQQEGISNAPSVLDEEEIQRGRIIKVFLLILEKIYGIHQSFEYPIILTAVDRKSGLERYFKVNLDLRFIDVRPLKEVKPLTDEERAFVMDHLIEPELIREIVPPENFEIRGMTLVRAEDVTESEVISALERDLIDQESVSSQKGFLRVQDRLRVLFQRRDLVASLAAIHEDQVLLVSLGCEICEKGMFFESRHLPLSVFEGTFYERAVQTGKILLISDVLQERFPQHAEESIKAMGVRSLIVAPLHYKGVPIGTLDIASSRTGDLSVMDIPLMAQIQPLFAVAIKRVLDDYENRIQRAIKEKCTAIHPSVEWRFHRAAIHHLESTDMGRTSEMEPIVFRDVYPLYGATDIRGSSQERNRAIQRDLGEHLNMGLRVVQLAYEDKPLPILKELSGRIQSYLERIQTGVSTGDEVSVVQFLRREVESLFPHIKGFGNRVGAAIEGYENTVDPNLGVVFKLRKDFEESVSRLSERLAAFLDQEEEKAQATFPHYFERHRTDGVDYLIYIGASLMQQGSFNELYLKDLRLWQLKVACGMATITEQLKSSLKLSLDTAHLVLVQNTPLSIRFRFDERRFDVDGAYDIRHDIVRSRLDKAQVKGGKERLTQPGKIAIVYSHPEEAAEMQRHIQFMQAEDYLSDEIERLELEDLPGVQGLKALRVSVKNSVLPPTDVVGPHGASSIEKAI
jgi:hypothetical protein